MFLSSMILGMVGLLAMTALGVGHGSAGHGHTHGHTHGPSHEHSDSSHGSNSGSKWLSLVSPRIIFSLALGFGAVGLVAEKFMVLALSIPLAIVGAIVLEKVFIQPYWTLMMRFASKPAQNLENTIYARAKAVMDFDASGSGLIELEVDGQVRQVLGTLKSGGETRIARGETLRIESVTVAGNCIVSRIA